MLKVALEWLAQEATVTAGQKRRNEKRDAQRCAAFQPELGQRAVDGSLLIAPGFDDHMGNSRDTASG